MDRSRMLASSVHDLPQDHSFNGIDVVKFICAFLICMIHISPFQSDLLGLTFLNYWIKQYICRIAVPFYFVSSGFLLFRKTPLYPPDGNRVRDFTLKNLRLLGTWYFLLFQGEKVHLWFLGALVSAVCILTFLLKKRVSLHYIGMLVVFLYAIGMLGDSYHALIDPLRAYFVPNMLILGYENIFGLTRNGFFFGMLFVLMGAVFARKRIVLRKTVAFAGLIVSLVLMFFEAYVLHRFTDQPDHNFFVFLPSVVFFLFYLASHADLPDKPVYARLRAIGILIFFLHLLVDFFVKFAIKAIIKLYAIDLFCLHFVMSIGVTVVLAIIIERLSQTEKFRWLKYLYS